MSFVTSIRDYIDTLNTMSDTWGQNLTLTQFLSETALYILKTLQASFVYIFSFQWIRDFTLLPVVLPQQTLSVFKETFFLETPSQVFFDFLELPYLHENEFLLGFFNSFFLSLPFSVVHIVAIRRLLIKGIPAGVYSIAGYLMGQILFLAFTVFGVRQILIPWLTLEPLNYLVGFIVIFQIIYSMTRETLAELKGWSSQYNIFFLTSFLLAWCEQTSLFQYIGNLTAGSTITILETFSHSSVVSSFWGHLFYLIGISIGSFFFTCLWGVFFLQVKKWFILYTPFFLTAFIQFVNKSTLVLALALSLTSIPFYGFDYLLTGPLGFVSQDILLNNTGFDQRNEKLPPLDNRMSGIETQFKYIHVDVAPFDRGDYLLTVEDAPALSFEELNYRGEFDWTGRANYQGIIDSRSSFFSLSKLLKKQKTSTQKSQFSSSQPLKSNILLARDLDTVKMKEEKENMSGERLIEHYDMPEGTDDSLFFQAYQNLSKKSFSADYLRTEAVFGKNIEKKIKDKYYSNPVYRTLLKLDIDLFLKRQPQIYQISVDQENDLSLKRRMLESYYDSLRDYSQLPYSSTFETFFDGTKSFSTKVYNQQFKGTLRSVRRLFSLTLTNETNNESSEIVSQKERVLKFDLPLYIFSEKFSPYHEELANQTLLEQKEIPNNTVFNNIVFKPLFAGWDEKSRQFVITNKLLPKRLTGYKVAIDSEVSKSFLQNSQKESKGTRKIKFTTWPLSPEKIEQEKIPSVTLYETLTPETWLALPIDSAPVDTVPSNFARYKIGQKDVPQKNQDPFECLTPKKGGFIWPGKTPLNLSFLTQ